MSQDTDRLGEEPIDWLAASITATAVGAALMLCWFWQPAGAGDRILWGPAIVIGIGVFAAAFAESARSGRWPALFALPAVVFAGLFAQSLAFGPPRWQPRWWVAVGVTSLWIAGSLLGLQVRRLRRTAE